MSVASREPLHDRATSPGLRIPPRRIVDAFWLASALALLFQLFAGTNHILHARLVGIAFLATGLLTAVRLALWPFETITDHAARRVLALVFAASALLLFSPRFVWDDFYYYAPLRSLVYDGDLNLVNEAAFGPFESFRPIVPSLSGRGYTWDAGKIGETLLWLPFYLLARLGVWAANLLGNTLLDDGMSGPFPLVTGIGTLCYTLLGLVCVYRACRRFADPWASLVATLGTYSCSMLPAFVYLWSLYSHALSYAMAAVFLDVWLTVRERGLSPLAALVVGILGGWAMCVRPQNLLLAAIPLVDLAFLYRRRHDRAALAGALAGLAFGFALGFLPQVLVLVERFGWPPRPHRSIVYMNDASWVLLRVLLHPLHGLFLWHPLLLLGLVGIGVLARRHPATALALALVVLGTVFTAAYGLRWHAGGSFGHRIFSSCVVFCSVGLAALLDLLRGRRVRAAILVALVAGAMWNLLLLAQFDVGRLGHSNPLTWQIAAAQFIEGPTKLTSLVRQAEWVEIVRLASPDGRVLPLFGAALLLAAFWRLRLPAVPFPRLAKVLVALALTINLAFVGVLSGTRRWQSLWVAPDRNGGYMLPFAKSRWTPFRGGTIEEPITAEAPLEFALSHDPAPAAVCVVASYLDGDVDVEVGRPAATIAITDASGTVQTFELLRGVHTALVDAAQQPRNWAVVRDTVHAVECWPGPGRPSPPMQVYRARFSFAQPMAPRRLEVRYLGQTGRFVLRGMLFDLARN